MGCQVTRAGLATQYRNGIKSIPAKSLADIKCSRCFLLYFRHVPCCRVACCFSHNVSSFNPPRARTTFLCTSVDGKLESTSPPIFSTCPFHTIFSSVFNRNPEIFAARIASHLLTRANIPITSRQCPDVIGWLDRARIIIATSGPHPVP